MKINGTIFSKPQQGQLKRGIGAELDKVVAKVDDVDKRMLNYMGDWASGNEYHENDIVTWGTDGHLYEIIKAHTSSSTINPSNTEYYKAMTASKAEQIILSYNSAITEAILSKLVKAQNNGKQIKVELPVPNSHVVIAPSVNPYKIYGYTTLTDDSHTSYKEFNLVGEKNSTIKVYMRTVSMSNPSSAPAFSEAGLSGNIIFTIGL